MLLKLSYDYNQYDLICFLKRITRSVCCLLSELGTPFFIDFRKRSYMYYTCAHFEYFDSACTYRNYVGIHVSLYHFLQCKSLGTPTADRQPRTQPTSRSNNHTPNAARPTPIAKRQEPKTYSLHLKKALGLKPSASRRTPNA